MGSKEHEKTQRPLVGESPRTKQVIRNIERVASGRWPVLVLGETGTGKEVVAKSIYQARQDGPFVTIDCSSLVGPLMESELFGHVKGSFSGASNNKIGLIELANGGTAFFDEIGELPLEAQSKLLRVLQEKEFRPVGSTTTKKSDFRIIAATNRDLLREVERGTFRRDLYYRLNVVTIRLEPLRERTEDLQPLVNHFLALYGSGHELSQAVWDAFHEYEWLGNVRELENCILQMVAMHTGPTLHTGDMPSALQNAFHAKEFERQGLALAPALPAYPEAVDAASTSVPRVPARSEDIPIVPLVEVERREILRALKFTGGDRGLAAHLLGIGRTTLYRKLKEYEVAV